MPLSTPWTLPTSRLTRPSPYARPLVAGLAPRASAANVGLSSQVQRALGIIRPPSCRAPSSTVASARVRPAGTQAGTTGGTGLGTDQLAVRTDALHISYTVRARTTNPGLSSQVRRARAIIRPPSCRAPSSAVAATHEGPVGNPAGETRGSELGTNQWAVRTDAPHISSSSERS